MNNDHGSARSKSAMPLFDRQAEPADFELYDKEHPDIWQNFEKITLNLVRHGSKHYGSRAIFEIIRYHRFIEKGDDYKVNNNYTKNYALKFMREYPQHDGFFETREQKVF